MVSQRQIQQAAYRTQLEIDRAEQVVVGVNKFNEDSEATEPVLSVDPKLEDEQERTEVFRSRQNRKTVNDLLML